MWLVPKGLKVCSYTEKYAGMFSPEDAKINFSVPIESIKSTNLAPVKPNEIRNTV